MSAGPVSARAGACAGSWRARSWRGGSTAQMLAAASSSEGAGYTLISTELLAQLLQLTQCPCSTEQLPTLRNRYFALRHGQSEANVEGIISSSPEVGTVTHGLTAEGRLQARRAATALVDIVGREHLSEVYFYSSDFTRALQTAEEALGAVRNLVEFENSATLQDRVELARHEIVITPLLRERWFGALDGQPLRTYQQVWPRDLVSAEHSHASVESVASVTRRIRELILQIEREREGCSVVLVSHADTLQIAQMFLAGTDPRAFSMYRFRNGEARRVLKHGRRLAVHRCFVYKKKI
ncbi:histidine phosphatase superfamily [Pavlovales sp. CCMP2436]|nr:histidine phosphatase superfamily [Pavlovales sp. CCMP2436]